MKQYLLVAAISVAVGLLFALFGVGRRGSNFLTTFIVATFFILGIGVLIVRVSEGVQNRWSLLRNRKRTADEERREPTMARSQSGVEPDR